MATSIYLAATEASSGKSAVAVGLLYQLRRRAGRVGVFRPVVADGGGDSLVELLVAESGTERAAAESIGVDYADIHADPEAAMSAIVDRFHAVAAGCDTVLVVGSDFTDAAAPTEFSVNAQIAANLGSSMVLVLPAGEHSPQDVARAAEISVAAARESHATVGAVIANRVPQDNLAAYGQALGELLDPLPTFALPQMPVLAAPTLADLQAAVGGELLHGDPALLNRESLGLIVAAMTLPNVLDRLVEGGVVVVPGDREEVVLGALLAHRSSTFPSLTGLVLNGGFPLSPQVKRLIEGLDLRLPIVSSPFGTMKTVTLLDHASAAITPTSTRKIEAAVEMVEGRVDAPGLLHDLGLADRDVVTPLMFEHGLVEGARAADAHIVLPEGLEPRILESAAIVRARGIARLTVLGDEAAVRAVAAAHAIDLADTAIVDPQTSPWREQFAAEYARLRAHKGVTEEHALDVIVDPSYFGTMMVHLGYADAMVSGSVTTTAATVRPALEIVRTAPGVSVVSSVFFMCLADRVLVYGDCAINPDPTAEQLADIAISSAQTAAQFGIEPRVAMLSYSTGASGTGVDVDHVRTATELVRSRRPDLLVEGPIQYDAAVDPHVAATKLKGSQVAGRATVLVFPDLNTGNNTYKAVQRSAQAVAVGPVLQGLAKPINDLSRGALVRDIVNTIAISAVQCGGRS